MSRRGVLLLGGALAAALVTMALAWMLSAPLDVRAGSPRTNAAFEVRLGWAVGEVRVTVDGRDAAAATDRSGRLLRLDGRRFDDGAHDVRVEADAGLPLAGPVRRSWRFIVDTTAPRVGTFEVHRTVRAGRIRIGGRTEPGARVRGHITESRRRASAVAGADGRYRLAFDIREGRSTIRLAVSDRAGNTRPASRRITRDTRPPRVDLAGLGDRWETADPVLRGRVNGERNAEALVTVDGRPATAAPVPVRRGRFTARLTGLHEGEHRVRVRVADAAGNAAEAARTVLVDSTETLGSAVVGPGARGADARRLLRLLRRYGGLDGAARDAIGPSAVRSVRAFQRRKGLAVDGLVGPDVRSALLGRLPGRVEIDLSERRLTLVRGETPTRSYPVAVGQPRYPTPTGSFRIVDKQVDPIWTPPNSPWAAELDTIPAGPGNPLGTRWIGTSRPAIGIHGTHAVGSIGTAASHGCVRMRIADVEELYREITVGTPITIRR